MIMARSIILSLAVLHFGSALVTGQAVEESTYQVVRGIGKCASSGRIVSGQSCAEAFRHFAEMHGYTYSGTTTGTANTHQCRAKVNDSAKTVTATYQEDASVGANAETHVACTTCAADKRMLGADDTDYECKAALASFVSGNAGKARCPIGQVYDNSACHEVTTICPTEFVPYVDGNRATKCAYVGLNPTWKTDGVRMAFGDMEAPAGYLLPKAGKVQEAAYMSSKECYDLLLAAAPAMKKWRDLSWASKKLDFVIPDGTTSGICYAEVTAANEFKGGLSAGPLSGDKYPVVSECGSGACLRVEASGWKCGTCAADQDEVPLAGKCSRGKVAAWKDNSTLYCRNEAHPVCEAGYTPIIDAGVANCYFGYMRLREPTPPCPELHTFTRTENGQWKCTRDTDATCFEPETGAGNTCPAHYIFQEVETKWKCNPGANAVCLLKNEVCPAHLSFNEENEKCEAGANVIVAEKEKIKCYLGKNLVEDTETGEWKCDKVDVKCPKGYKQDVADNKIECKAEGGNSGSIHATASFAAMISVVGAVLMRM